MCGGSEKLNSKTLALASAQTDNDAEGFKEVVGDGSAIDEIGLWYSFHGVLKKMVLECRTPLMVAAMYGSVDVVKLILSFTKADINLSCGLDKSMALHYAASSGSINVVDVVKLLILAGADFNATDANGHRPFDLIFAHWNLFDSRVTLEELLKNSGCKDDLRVSTVSLRFSSPSLSSSSDNDSCVQICPCLMFLARLMIYILLLLWSRKNTLLIRLFLTSRAAFIHPMNSRCFHSKSGLVPKLICMIEQNVLLPIRARMQGE
ncbi:hypothetical protein Q3G72_033523 [Acer saccharum]|nr:hypothetical protein Q3G72_033523 [Acer saccharum]